MVDILLLIFLNFGRVFCALDLSGCRPNEPKIIDTVLTLHGDLYSPGYLEGQPYPRDLFCEYTLKAPKGFQIRLTFVDFDLDATMRCQSESLKVYEGENKTNPVHGVFCGNNSYPDIISENGSLHLVFVTDFLKGSKGFHLKYKTTDTIGHCQAGQKPCRNRRCIKASNICNGEDECGDGTDEENCGFPAQSASCGLKPTNSTAIINEGPDRIIGGKEATPYSWPWQADLQLAFVYPNGHKCGGSLINAQWVVTAAHCLGGNRNPKELRVHLGNHHKFHQDKYEQIRYVTRLVVYPEITGEELISWEQKDLNNDIALMKLNAPVQFNDYVRPACLPKQGYYLKPDTKCIATGWGMTRGTGFSNALKEVELTVEAPEKCSGDNGDINNKTMICVKNRGFYQDVCHGDSGGPLSCEIDSKWYVMGATSYGTRGTYLNGICALVDSYTVFVRIADKIDWIEEIINKY